MTDDDLFPLGKPASPGARSPVADPAAAASAKAAVPGDDWLLATKLHVPRPQPGFVPRPRLAEALGEGLARGRVLVCAPPGSGKTAMLVDWARGEGAVAGWLTLDVSDNDPARFWCHVVAALDPARPGLAARMGSLTPGSPRGLVATLVNELAGAHGDAGVTLVLDDYHLIDSRPVHESVAFLLENLPAGLRVVMSSRADPPLPLARLRARGKLAELRAADLRFTPQEAAALLSEIAGPDLPAGATEVLAVRTEGWAAGLRLAGLSLRGHPDAAGFVASFSGSHRFVLDYLAIEVLDGQPDQVRAFLVETSVLERLSGAPMRALLAQLAAAQTEHAAHRVDHKYLAILRRAFDQAGATSPGLAEPLTGRELEVLRLIAAGRSNQRIARELVVALDTVKKHVSHVLGKLGASNRTEAAALARQQGLIP